MKIAYISLSGIPSQTAQSINIMRACSAMSLLGHELTLLAPSSHPERVSGIEDVFGYYGVPDNFRIRYLPRPDAIGGRRLYASAVALFVAWWRPRVAIGRYLKATQFAARAGTDIIYELHSSIKNKRRPLARLAASKRFKLMVVHTQPLRRHVIEQAIPGLDETHVLSLPHGREALTAPVSPQAIPKATGGFRIGYIGKLQRQKGLGLIEGLIPLLPEHDFDILGGEADQVEELRTRFPRANVRFHGYVPQVEIPSYVAAMDICLLPNEPHPENPPDVLYSSPMKVRDYMALGKTILASDLGEIREMLDEDSAVLLPPGDAEAWAAAVAGLNAEEANRLGTNALRSLEERFTMQARYRQILEAAGVEAQA